MGDGLTHRFAIFTAATTVLLILAGGLVTSTGSGLSVPDWPLSYGQLMPPMVGGIRFEHSHRQIAGFVGILTLALTVLVWLREKRRWVKHLALGALVAVVVQAVLGGLTVIYLLPTWISVSHACLAQTFLCLVAALALCTGREWRGGERIDAVYAGSIQRLLVAETALVYLQLILGAVVRHTNASVKLHIVNAFLIAMHSIFILLKIAREERVQKALFRHSALLGIFVTFQVFLGFGAFIMTRMLASEPATVGQVLFATAHQTLGALILVTSFLLTLRAYRLLRRDRETESTAVFTRVP